MHKNSLGQRFKILLLAFVEGGCWLEEKKNTESSTFKTLGEVRSGSLKMFFFIGEPVKVLQAVRACKTIYCKLDVTNVTF